MATVYHNGEFYGAGTSPIDDTKSSGSTTYSSEKIDFIVGGVNEQIDDLHLGNTTKQTYTFPTSAAEMEDDNNICTIQKDGVCFFEYVFNDSPYSQFGLYLNGTSVTSGNISSGENGLASLKNVLTFPVRKGDIVRVLFYAHFAMTKLSLRVL